MTPDAYAAMLEKIAATDDTDPYDVAECLACGFKWDDSISTLFTPAPVARCPNEYNHAEES